VQLLVRLVADHVGPEVAVTRPVRQIDVDGHWLSQYSSRAEHHNQP
jgi:hypothetical protein